MCGCWQLNLYVIQPALEKPINNLPHPSGAAWIEEQPHSCGSMASSGPWLQAKKTLYSFHSLQESPHCAFVTFPSHQSWLEPWCLCLILKTFRVPNGLQSSVSPLTFTEGHKLGSDSPRAAVALWQDKRLSCQVELWASAAHMGCSGWLCALSASC